MGKKRRKVSWEIELTAENLYSQSWNYFFFLFLVGKLQKACLAIVMIHVGMGTNWHLKKAEKIVFTSAQKKLPDDGKKKEWKKSFQLRKLEKNWITLDVNSSVSNNLNKCKITKLTNFLTSFSTSTSNLKFCSIIFFCTLKRWKDEMTRGKNILMRLSENFHLIKSRMTPMTIKLIAEMLIFLAFN